MGVGTIDRILEAAAFAIGIREYRSAEIATYLNVFKQTHRLYHGTKHTEDMMVFADADLMRSIGNGEIYNRSQMWQSIAGFKHDLFQLKIDSGLPKGFEWVAGIGLEDGKYTVNQPDAIDSEIFDLVCKIFGFEIGQKLEKGANEFLTALENAHDLKMRGANIHDIVAITACIEASIPFRGKDKIYNLCNRIKGLDIGLSDKEVDEIGYTACNFANRDVENFAGRILKFIDNLRKNIPELAPKAREDCKAVDSRDCFIDSINLMKATKAGKVNVFCEYKEMPNLEKRHIIQRRSKRNSDLAELYLQARYVSSTLLGAIAIKYGRVDIKLNEIAGSLQKFQDSFPTISAELSKDEAKVLEALLGHEQTTLVGVDNSAAPLAAFVFRRLGKGVSDLFEKTRECNFSDRLSVEKYLHNFQTELGAGNMILILRELKGLSFKSVTP